MNIVQKSISKFRGYWFRDFVSWLRINRWRVEGLTIGKDTKLFFCRFTWPHKVKIGSKCNIKHDVYFNHASVKPELIWSPGKSIVIGDRVFIGNRCEFNIIEKITIGNDTLIASGCKFIDHNHGFKDIEKPINTQLDQAAEIIIDDNVWLGVNVVVLKGVTIKKGAIVGAGAVVTKDIGENEIWAGIPAKLISKRGS